MSWIEDPNVFCVLVPEDIELEGTGERDADAIAKHTAAQIWPNNDQWHMMPLDDPRFVDAFDLTLEKMKRELVSNWNVQEIDRPRGVLELVDRTGVKSPTRRHLRVILLDGPQR